MLLFQRVIITILCVYILKKSIIIKKNFSVAFTCFRIQNWDYIMIFNYSLIFKTFILKCTYVSPKKNFMIKFIYKLRGRCIWRKTNLHKINICCQIGTLHFIGRVLIIISKLALVRIIDFAEHLVQAYNKPPIIHFLLST